MILSKLSRPKAKYRKLVAVMNVLLAMTGLGAVVALVLEYGGDLSPTHEWWVHNLQWVVLAVFVLDRFIRGWVAQRRRTYFRENWLDFALIAAVVAAIAIATNLRGSIRSAGTLYVLVAQAYIVLALILRGINLNMRLAGSGLPPAWLLVGSFAVLAAVGSGLLMLPAATPGPDSDHYRPIDYMDALFTSVSATCVTGLVVRDTGQDFTLFGQVVILVLIQLGGLGMMLFGTALAMAVGKSLSLRSSAAVGEMLAVDTVGRVGRTMWFVIVTTLALEALGALMFYGMFTAPQGGQTLAPGEAIWQSIFHSISSFCNAGFSLYGRNMMQGVPEGWPVALRDHWQIMGVMAPLIVLGGLGFPVLQELCRYAFQRGRRLLARWRSTIGSIQASTVRPLSLHAKIVLTTTLGLLVLGAAGLLLFESTGGGNAPRIGQHPLRTVHTAEPNDWQGLSLLRRVREVTFQSVTARTAGFNTIDMSELSQAGKLWMCGLMTIGGSPGGTAGGMKTVTFALLILAAVAALRRRKALEAFRRRIAVDAFQRAVAIAVLYAALVAVVTLLLSVAMRPGADVPLIDVLFEASSACGTVGLSTGLTERLTILGKSVIVGAMFIGRLGPLTLLLAMTARQRHVDYAYAAENVVIG